MPPRKSDASKAVTADEATPAKDASKDAQRDTVNIEDLNLPKSIVTRLAKGVLPANTQIQSNAMLAMTKSATVFVNYLASHANEYAQQENRKTLGPQDVLRALNDIEFPDFKPRLEAELAKYNELQTDKRNNYKNKVAANKVSGKHTSPPPGEEGELEPEHEREDEPVAKKARRDPGDAEGSGKKKKDSDDTADEGGEENADDVEDEDEDATEGEDKSDDDDADKLEENDGEETQDEALDNGEDSD